MSTRDLKRLKTALAIASVIVSVVVSYREKKELEELRSAATKPVLVGEFKNWLHEVYPNIYGEDSWQERIRRSM